jgi:hypothetical protein
LSSTSISRHADSVAGSPIDWAETSSIATSARDAPLPPSRARRCRMVPICATGPRAARGSAADQPGQLGGHPAAGQRQLDLLAGVRPGTASGALQRRAAARRRSVTGPISRRSSVS